MFGGSDNLSQGSRFEPIQKLEGLNRSPQVKVPTESESENHQAFLAAVRKGSDVLLWDSNKS
jgi:hypothetical protein